MTQWKYFDPRPMTEAEIVKASIDHVFQQGEPSMDGDMCLYRSREGLQCGASIFISDEEYSEELEGESFGCTGIISPLSSEEYRRKISLIEKLQSAHDDAADVAEEIQEPFLEIYRDNIERLVPSFLPENFLTRKQVSE